jgi:RimJ/RimL family protein N-acetyltransferase
MWNDIKGKRCLEVGYILKKTYWGKGYATEGAGACIKYGFELFGADKIYATIRPENTLSIAVAERIGNDS